VLWGDETVSMGINCVFFVLGALLGSFFFLFVYIPIPTFFYGYSPFGGRESSMIVYPVL
jgi:hypothetical protein